MECIDVQSSFITVPENWERGHGNDRQRMTNKELLDNLMKNIGNELCFFVICDLQ